MSSDLDIINTTLNDLRGPIEFTFEAQTPVYDMINKKGKVSTERGNLIERVIMGGATSTGTGIIGGGEKLNLSRTEQTHKIQVETHRIVIPLTIPKKQMKINEGKLGAIKLIDTYVQANVKAIPVAVDRFLLTGVTGNSVLSTTALSGWNTMNGQKTFATGLTGVTQGLFEFAAPTSQNDTVQNLAKSSSYGYVNQYGEISSYALDGKRTYRRVLRECGQGNVSDMSASADIGFMDFDSFALLEEDQESHARTVVVQQKLDKPGNQNELWIGNTKIIPCKNLVLTDLTGDAAEGLCYFLTSEGWEWVWFQKPELSSFDDRIADQDLVVAKMEMQGCPLVTGMRMQGVVVGGARA